MTESRIAIIAADGTYTYDQLDEASRRVSGSLLGDNADLNQTRVAFLVQPSFAYAAVQRGIWRAGGVAVPLAVSHPPPELEYVIRDSAASVVVADAACAPRLSARACRTRALRQRCRRAQGHSRTRSAASRLGTPRADHLHERNDGTPE